MLKIEKHKILAPYTSLQVGSAADFFAVIQEKSDLLEAINWAKLNHQPIFVLGGGSNVLITKRFKGLVLKNELRGFSLDKISKNSALISARSGETWSKFVNFAVVNNFYGAENLFLIPGTVGAAPVQNIGAYGVELKDIFVSLQAINLKTGAEKIFFASDCRFAYRQSIFKDRLKGKYFIYSVTLRLQRVAKFKLNYGAITAELAKKNITKPDLRAVIQIIQEIRNNKLPNPAILPNAGSFFKNPEISPAVFKRLIKKHPAMPFFPGSQKKVKLSAGWLIEQTGWKGKNLGPVGMYEKQALVLVNHGQADARQILALVKKVKSAVRQKFGLDLQEEVNII